LRIPNYAADLDAKDTLEADLHDLTNALAAARSFAEVVKYRLSMGQTAPPAAPASPGAPTAPRPMTPDAVEPLLEELDRMNDILQSLRRRTYRAGDVLECTKCGYSFVFRKATGKRATCLRCHSTEVDRWKPAPPKG
jgi:predicted Zn-ribbon and HTH transcriptional regulator